MNYYIGHSKSHKGLRSGRRRDLRLRQPDHQEAFDIGFQAADDHPLVLAGTPLIGANEWPDLPDFPRAGAGLLRRGFRPRPPSVRRFRPRARSAGRVFQTDGDLPAGQAAADPFTRSTPALKMFPELVHTRL